MEKGIVSRYISDKGYGFVNDGRGKSFFFHIKSRAWGEGDPAIGEALLFERGVDPQGRSRAEWWIPARDADGLVEIHGCFLAPDVLSQYPFLRSLLESYSKTWKEWGSFPVNAESLALKLPDIKKWRPDDISDKLGERDETVYVIARGKTPVALRKGFFLMDDILQPGPSVATELLRLGYKDSDISAIVRIYRFKAGVRSKPEYSITVYI